MLKYSILLLLCFGNIARAQQLQPGFDKSEYLELMKICARQGDSSYAGTIAEPRHSLFRYRSPVVGLENRWDLWIKDKATAVLSIRGTTASSISWLANFYAAMVPAKGQLSLRNGTCFPYQLADNPRAAVHIGWLIATAALIADMRPKLDSLMQHQVRDIVIIGHSQGGAIAYLLTAYLYHLRTERQLPEDLRIKTYCSAAPKPGNLYFAYDYETMTRNGWAFNVVNSADWVPETPVSIQTLDDFNTTNPFINARDMARKQRFPGNLLLLHAINRMDRPTRRAQKQYQRFLGKYAAGMVARHLKEYTAPEYLSSCNYVRTGQMIVLRADSAYYRLFPDNPRTIFIHHFFAPYLYLAERQL